MNTLIKTIALAIVLATPLLTDLAVDYKHGVGVFAEAEQ